MAFIHVDDELWADFLKTVSHDVYHLPGYCAIEAWLLNGEALAWVHKNREDQYLIPLIKRPIKGTKNACDLVSPYGYPGLLCTRLLTAFEAGEALSLFHQEAAQQGFVSSFIRLNPFFNEWKFENNLPFRQWMHGATVSIDLNLDLDEIRNGFSLNHKRNIHRFRNFGFQSRINDYASINDFLEAYRQTMQRRKAAPYYFFPDTYFSAIKALLGEKLLYFSIYDNGGQFLAGGLFSLFGKLMQFHLGASSEPGLRYSSSKWMMDMAIAHGKTLGANTLHLGGGLGGNTNDGLFRFKKGFANQIHSYSSLRFIHNKELFNQLNGKVAPAAVESFFPEYRALQKSADSENVL